MRALLALLLAAPASASPIFLDRALLLVDQLGGHLNISLPPAPAAPAAAPVLPLSPHKDYLSGSGTVTGSGPVQCSSMDGSGQMSGNIWLNGSIPVQAGALRGNIQVSGSIWLRGTCTNNQGFASGNADLSGSGTIYDQAGKPHHARISGSAYLSQYVSSSYAWINQSVTFSGAVD
jgi:hypothetical protein